MNPLLLTLCVALLGPNVSAQDAPKQKNNKMIITQNQLDELKIVKDKDEKFTNDKLKKK